MKKINSVVESPRVWFTISFNTSFIIVNFSALRKPRKMLVMNRMKIIRI